ncbi:hypothetical protein [Lysobacter arvi]|uniref:Adhesin domain-containing protein n=1 Tax=Lysobacter arvi TaxID=3038776 RepID=A0ABU1CAR6_9GAMM|nr:hypothetical protein [Lysobacter arvi]MDR0182284.1 hypothetical protein [Lysobacter arvi]
MRKPTVAFALLPLALFAGQALADECRHSEPRNLALDFTGVKTVMFDIGPHDLTVTASPGEKGAVQGKACASNADRLKELSLTQQRLGDKIVVTAKRQDTLSISFGGANYAYLSLNATVPDNVLVQLDVGSGDARVSGAAALSADVGSGDVQARNIRGLVTADVNSGDIELDTIGSLRVLSVGSGDLSARRVKTDVEVGSVGSGDVDLRDVGGNVSVDSIGSGGVEAQKVGGNVIAGKIGSGGLDAHDVGGNLTVRRVGSGGVDHSGVRGNVSVPADD